MDLRKISDALKTLNASNDESDFFQAFLDVRSEGKEVEWDDERQCFCASGTYTPPTSAKEVFERARRYRQQ